MVSAREPLGITEARPDALPVAEPTQSKYCRGIKISCTYD